MKYALLQTMQSTVSCLTLYCPKKPRIEQCNLPDRNQVSHL